MLTLIIWSICLCGSTGPRAQPKHLGLLMSLPGKPPWHASAISRLCNVWEYSLMTGVTVFSIWGQTEPDFQPAWINSILLRVQRKKKKSDYTPPRPSPLVYLWTETCECQEKQSSWVSRSSLSDWSGQQMSFSLSGH